MTSFSALPDEILRIILHYLVSQSSDLIKFGSLSKACQFLSNYSSLWLTLNQIIILAPSDFLKVIGNEGRKKNNLTCFLDIYYDKDTTKEKIDSYLQKVNIKHVKVSLRFHFLETRNGRRILENGIEIIEETNNLEEEIIENGRNGQMVLSPFFYFT